MDWAKTTVGQDEKHLNFGTWCHLYERFDGMPSILQTKERVDFDVETAVKVCRSAGYYQHALYLAEQHNQHDWYLKIQLEDIQNYQMALQYIGKLEFSEVSSLSVNTLRPKRNGCHFADGIFKCISLNENLWFWLTFHWSLFLSVKLTIFQHCFR